MKPANKPVGTLGKAISVKDLANQIKEKLANNTKVVVVTNPFLAPNSKGERNE